MLTLLICSVLCSDNPVQQTDLNRTDDQPRHYLWRAQYERSSNGITKSWKGGTHDEQIIVYVYQNPHQEWGFQVVWTDGVKTQYYCRLISEAAAVPLLQLPPGLAYLEMTKGR